MFPFISNYQWVFQNGYTPTSNVWEFQLLHICTNIWCCQSFNFSYGSGCKVIFHSINIKDNMCMLRTFSCVCELLTYLLLWSVYSKISFFFLTVFLFPLARRHELCDNKTNLFQYIPQEMLFSKVITLCKKRVFHLSWCGTIFNAKLVCCKCTVFLKFLKMV